MSFSLTDRLVELNAARENGLITEEEYKTMRTRLLESFTTLTPSQSSRQRQTPPPAPPPRSSTNSAPGSPVMSPHSVPVNIIKVLPPPLPPTEQQSSGNATTRAFFSPPLRPTISSNPPSPIPQNRSRLSTSNASPIPVLQTRQNVNASTLSRRHARALSMSELNSNISSHLANISEFEPIPEVPPPPYTPPESSQTRKRRTSSFFKQKSPAELRKELSKLIEDAKKAKDSLKMQEARLMVKVGTKPEEIERVRKKMRDSAEKYQRKIDVVNLELRRATINE